MSLLEWIVRGALFLILLPILLPLVLLVAGIVFSPLSLALLLLALVVIALGVVVGIALGMIGNLLDVLIVLGLIGLAWAWPRGMRASFWDKLRFAYRRLGNALRRQVRQGNFTDLILCLAVVLIVAVLSLSSGVIHFLLTLTIVLLAIGIVWKWPRTSRLSFFTKLRIALYSLHAELRRFLR